MPRLTIDPALKHKCPRTALGFLTARVITHDTSPELAEEMTLREKEILALAEPRVVLESPKILATRAG